MRRLTTVQVHSRKVGELGLDSGALRLSSTEAIAGALRRASSFLCPCTAATLVRGVVRPLRGLVDDLDEVKSVVEDTLEAMMAHGDILEQAVADEDSGHGATTLLHAAPPSFVERESGGVMLLGSASDQLHALPEELEGRVEYVRYLRRLPPAEGEDLTGELVQLGLIQLSYDRWLKRPRSRTAAQHLSELNRLLDAAQPSRDVPGLTLLDWNRPVRYYRGRWTEPRSHSGRFVARRSQAYGADLWSFVEVERGSPQRLVDFPSGGSRWRGCDEAWRLQMAIDAERGEPQRFRLRSSTEGVGVIELFSPVPMWARRRWDAIGEPMQTRGSLFAYRLPDRELAEEIRFLRDEMWLEDMLIDSTSPPQGPRS